MENSFSECLLAQEVIVAMMEVGWKLIPGWLLAGQEKVGLGDLEVKGGEGVGLGRSWWWQFGKC